MLWCNTLLCQELWWSWTAEYFSGNVWTFSLIDLCLLFIWGIRLGCRRPRFHGHALNWLNKDSVLPRRGHQVPAHPVLCPISSPSHSLAFPAVLTAFCKLLGDFRWMGGKQHICKLLKNDGDFLVYVCLWNNEEYIGFCRCSLYYPCYDSVSANFSFTWVMITEIRFIQLTSQRNCIFSHLHKGLLVTYFK